MELQHLITLIAVADTGSLTRASEKLNLSQPAVSAQMKALEIELGLQIFRRTARGVVLNEAGKEIETHAKEVLAKRDQLFRLAERLRGESSSLLKLGTIDCGYDFKLAKLIGAFSNTHPDVEIQLIAANSGANTKAILDGELDVATIETDKLDERLKGTQLGIAKLGVIGPSVWRDELNETGWARLSEFPWVFQSSGCSYCQLLNQICQQHHIRLTPQIQAEAFGTVKYLVAEGLAMSIADLNEVSDLVETGDIFVWPHFEFQMPVWLICRRDRMHEIAIKTITEIAYHIHQDQGRRKLTDHTMKTELKK